MFMPGLFFDVTMVFLIPAVLFAMYAQMKVQSTFAKYSRVTARRGLTGAQVARALLDRAELTHVPVERIQHRLGDHYDPRSKVMRLSPEVYGSSSVAALGVAAHETGHALQHARDYVPLNVRNGLFPVARFGSTLAMPLFFIGFLFGGGGMGWLMDVGIYFFAAALAFQLVTLPVEFNASSRAMRLLTDAGYLATDEAPQARAVLNAAALTYVAAAAMAAMQLIRLLVLRNMRRD